MKRALAGVIALTCFFGSAALGDSLPFTFTASGTDGGGNALSASAKFSLDASGHLIVVLTNTASAVSTTNTDVLTGVFFDLNPQSTLLTQPAPQGSAILTSSSDTLLNIGNQPLQPFKYVNGLLDVSGEWGFGQSASGFNFTGASNGSQNNFSAHYGIESTGAAFGSTGVINPLSSYDYDSDNGLQGADFGIVPGNTTSVAGQQDFFIKKSVTYTLNFNPSLLSTVQVTNVHFVYGTSSSGEPDLTGTLQQTPTPAAPLPGVAWAGLALLGVLFGTQRRALSRLV